MVRSYSSNGIHLLELMQMWGKWNIGHFRQKNYLFWGVGPSITYNVPVKIFVRLKFLRLLLLWESQQNVRLKHFPSIPPVFQRFQQDIKNSTPSSPWIQLLWWISPQKISFNGVYSNVYGNSWLKAQGSSFSLKYVFDIRLCGWMVAVCAGV